MHFGSKASWESYGIHNWICKPVTSPLELLMPNFVPGREICNRSMKQKVEEKDFWSHSINNPNSWIKNVRQAY